MNYLKKKRKEQHNVVGSGGYPLRENDKSDDENATEASVFLF